MQQYFFYVHFHFHKYIYKYSLFISSLPMFVMIIKDINTLITSSNTLYQIKPVLCTENQQAEAAGQQNAAAANLNFYKYKYIYIYIYFFFIICSLTYRHREGNVLERIAMHRIIYYFGLGNI